MPGCTPTECRRTGGRSMRSSTGWRATTGCTPCADDTWLFVAAIESQQQAALDALSDDLEATFATRVAGDWFVELDQSGVPAEVVDETFCRAMFDDPEMRA